MLLTKPRVLQLIEYKDWVPMRLNGFVWVGFLQILRVSSLFALYIWNWEKSMVVLLVVWKHVAPNVVECKVLCALLCWARLINYELRAQTRVTDLGGGEAKFKSWNWKAKIKGNMYDCLEFDKGILYIVFVIIILNKCQPSENLLFHYSLFQWIHGNTMNSNERGTGSQPLSHYNR